MSNRLTVTWKHFKQISMSAQKETTTVRVTLSAQMWTEDTTAPAKKVTGTMTCQAIVKVSKI